MFQEYCFAHGNPCMAGLLYCCEECKNEDKEQFVNSNDIENEEQEEDYLAYEFCQCYTQVPFPKEAERNYSWSSSTTLRDNTSSEIDLTSQKDQTPRSDFVLTPSIPSSDSPSESLSRIPSSVNEDFLIFYSNQRIQSNYQKWLNLSSRCMM